MYSRNAVHGSFFFGFSVFIIILKHSPNKAPIKICYSVVINTDEGDKHEKNYDFTDEVF